MKLKRLRGQIKTQRWTALLAAILLVGAFFSSAHSAHAQRILFIRGGDGTGNLGGGNDGQLSDIADFSTAPGNAGWGELADTLRADGFEPVQMTEGPLENNAPVDLAGMDLTQFAVIVLGSNNADYPPEAVDAVEAFVRGGGGLLAISDANWGLTFGAAPSSDQAFLDRFGLIMNQDAFTYALHRDQGDFVVGGVDRGDHPILIGVDAFDGEGVSPLTLDSPSPGDEVAILAGAKQQVRENDNPNGGTFRPAGEGDAALAVVQAGAGRVVGHFDRNTFFNENGAGTDITRLDNRRYARNLFAFLAGGQTAARDWQAVE